MTRPTFMRPRNQTRTSYVVGFNNPGYLPEMEPYLVVGIDAARVALIDEMETTMEHLETMNGETELQWRQCQQMVRDWDGKQKLCIRAPDGKVYWLT
jgi:hypothetical protein